MARSYGRFTTSIYRDADFRSLTRAQQGVYFMLGLQADVTAAGVLSLTLRRWSQTASDDDMERLNGELAGLMVRGHIVIDAATEELLIVKFIKWDGGWSNSKRLPVVLEALRAIESVHIRDIAVDELRKLALSDAVSEEAKRSRDALSHALSGFDRVVVTSGESVPHPLTATQGGEPLPLASEPPSMFCPKHPNGTTDSCGPCGGAKRMFDAWHERDAERVLAGLEADRAARRACKRCNEFGQLEDHAGQILGRCDHSTLERVAS